MSYLQLKNLLIEKIIVGDWPKNSKIPDMKTICVAYGVKESVVRRAIKEMVNDGYLSAVSGKGTFVSCPSIIQNLFRFYSFSEDIENKGYRLHNEVIQFIKTPCTAEVAVKLSIEDHSTIFKIERVRYVDDIPFAVETSYIPWEICKELTAEMVMECGLYHSINLLSKLTPDAATEAFKAIIVGEKNSKLLQVKKTTPCMHIERVASALGRTFEYCDSVVRSDIIRYNVILK